MNNLTATPGQFIWRIVAVVFSALQAACGMGPPLDLPVHGVVLITLDTTRADLFDWSEGAPFPRIHQLFERGLRFEQAVSSSNTTGPAHATLFSGRLPPEHGVLNNAIPLDGKIETLAERMQDIGFRTAGFVSCSVLNEDRSYDQGFDHFDADLGSTYAPEYYRRSADETTQRAIDWVAANGDRPFFLWIHYFDAHAPYAPPSEFRAEGFSEFDSDPSLAPTIPRLAAIHRSGEVLPQRLLDYYRALYAGEVAFVDSQIGRLVDWLASKGFAENTLFALVGDHGEELGDHLNFFEHNRSPYDGVMRVPLALRAPGFSGRVVEGQVMTGSLAATLLEMLEQPVPAELLPSLLRGEPEPSVPFAMELHSAVRPWAFVLRDPPYKYVYWEDGREELYDVGSDAAERVDLGRARPAELERLRAQARNKFLPVYSSPEVARKLGGTIVEQDRLMLKALGYL